MNTAIRRSDLILDLVWLVFPCPKRRQGLFAHHLNHRNLALRVRLRDFSIDQRIVKPDSGSIGIGIAKINAGKASPVDCTQTHGARLAGSVDLAAFQIEDSKFLAGRANGNYLGVRGWIVGRGDLIGGFGNHGPVFDYDSAERSAASGVDV